MSSVSPDQIMMEGSKERPLVVPSWVAAQLSDVWLSIRKNIETSMKKKDKQDPVRNAQVAPAFSHNQT
jgi:hypothetical protein